MPKLDDYNDPDEIYNPANKLAKKEQAAGGEDFREPGGTSNSSQNSRTSSTQNVQNRENGFYEPDDNEPDRGASKTVSLRTIYRKRGATAALITLMLGLPTIIAIFLSPALVIQQFTEALTGEFNDQLGALDVRSTLLLKKKYNSVFTKNVCGTVVSIGCKYKTIRLKSGLAKRLENAGVTIKGDESLIPGRVKPTHFVFEGKEIPAKDLLKEARNNVSLQKALRKGYDPLYAAFSDRKAADIRTRLGLKRSSDVKASTDEKQMNEDLKETAAGENNIPESGEKLTAQKDENGNVTGYVDADGTVIDKLEGERINSLIDESIGQGKLAEKVGKAATKGSLKSVLTSTAFGAGAIDSACTAWTLIRVAGYAAKIYQKRQLARYYYEFAKFAHKQRYGDSTAEETEFFANKLTSVNSEGKNALDSDGYRFAAYGDSFNPGNFDAETANLKKGEVTDEDINRIMVQNETSRYINGQLISTSLMAKIATAITAGNSSAVDAADKTCGFVKSWKGQALVFGLAAAGAVVAFFTGSASVSVGAIAQGAVSVAVSVVFALLQPKLIDMAKGEVIKGDENGNETGNGGTSGAGGYNGEMSQGTGMGVATQKTYQDYNKLSTEVAAKYAEIDRSERSPLDPTSKNTFLGSIVATILPYTTKMQTVGSTSLALSSFVTASISSLGMVKTAKADSDDKYNQCDDPEYKSRDLAADPFCNLRYAIPVEDLNIDPDKVLDYMITGGYISEEDETPQGDYADYVAKCFDRKTSIGDSVTDYTDGEGESGGDAGDECIIGKGGSSEERNKMFRLFYIDTRISDGMEEDFDTAAPEVVGGIDLNIASFNVRGASHDGENGTISYQTRMKKTVETVQKENFDVIGFQEFETKQRTEFNAALSSTYTLSSNDGGSDNGNGIAWNSAKYDLVSKGTQPSLKYFNNGKLKAPWVKLKDKSTNQMFYFLNTHDPANVGGDYSAERTANAVQHVAFMKEKAAEGIPVFISGDFNSSFKKRTSPGGGDTNVTANNIKETLPYCVMTSGDTIKNAFDVYKNRDARCPNEDINWDKEDPGKGCSTQIDHLYILTGSQAATVNGFGCVRKGDKAGTVDAGNGSDHDTVKFSVSIAGVNQSSGAGSSFVIGSYNQKRALPASSHTAAVNNIVNSNMDVVGTQETSDPKFTRYRDQLKNAGYGSYPLAAGPNQTCSNAQAIFFKLSKFSLLKGEYFEIPRYPDPAVNCGNGEKTVASHKDAVADGYPATWTHIPVVWLQDVATKQTVIVINTHNVANVKGAAGTNPAKSRWRSAQIYIEQIQRLKSQNPGTPIFMTGDFNEGTDVRNDGNTTYQGKQENLFFCMVANTGLLKSVDGPVMKCDPKYSVGGVDYIYASPEVTVDWTKTIASGGGDSGPPSYTDHPVLYAKVTVPGSGAASPTTSLPSKDGWVWPVPDVKSMGTLPYGAKGSKGIHKGIDIGISGGAALGKTVVAAHDGTVNRVWGKDSACGTYISIAASDTKYYAAYQHVAGDSVLVKAGDKVKAGQPIAKIGRQGGSSCGSAGFFHLHFSIETRPGTVSEYADKFPNGTIDPLKVLPK